ncbi:MAG: M20/M25/M40 family metallo-hydrolase [Bdellovibrionales bacterium]|nr:M20/M25/M40 family metallo-hydrolase [Bdellovibrionales bacterium]
MVQFDSQSWFASHEAQALETLALWVAMNTHTLNLPGINDFQAVLAAEFANLDMGTKLTTEIGRGNHLVVTSSGFDRRRKRNTLLVGHADTVFPDTGSEHPFRIEDGWAYGPGVADDKGCLLVILLAMRALRELGVLDRLRLAIYINSQEEDPDPIPAELLMMFKRRSSEVLVFEPGRVSRSGDNSLDDGIITERKGLLKFTIKVDGRRAHAGNDHAEGVNAIHQLSLLIPALQAITDHDRGLTVNVGEIAGGIGTNVVPGKASCSFEVRAPRAEYFDEVRARILQICVPSIPGAQVTVHPIAIIPPLEQTAKSLAVYERMAAARRLVGLNPAKMELQGGGSDGNFLAAAGLPVIDGLGPFGEHFHNPDLERLRLDSIAPKVGALVHYLLATLEG